MSLLILVVDDDPIIGALPDSLHPSNRCIGRIMLTPQA